MKNEEKMQFDWDRILLAMIFFFAFAFLGSRYLGVQDFTYVLMWWVILILFGIAMQPLCICLFSKFHDGGWVFSKALGIGVIGWLLWFLSSCKLVKFTRIACFLALVFCFLVGIVLLYFLVLKRDRKFKLTSFYTPGRLTSMLSAEVIFFCIFVFWNYLKGINPAAYGTERYMDYAYMLSIFKSDYLPPKDMWLSGYSINYYYLGQYMAAFVSKTAGVPVAFGYNIAMMMLPAFGFCMPYSIVVNLMKTRLKDRQSEELTAKDLDQAHALGEAISKKEPFFRPVFAGCLAGIAVAFSSTMQYPIYKFLVPKLQRLTGSKNYYGDYYFANATRFIGYFPERDDKTIHEFPMYSYTIGDLHAHVVNTIFVMSILAILLGWMLRKKAQFDMTRTVDAVRLRRDSSNEDDSIVSMIGRKEFLKEVFDPAVITCAFLVGLSVMTNSWDFPIYFVVSGAIILFMNLVMNDFGARAWLLTACKAVVFLLIIGFSSIPFTLSFDSISRGFGITGRHTLLREFLVVWGLPVFAVISFLLYLIKKERKQKRKDDKRSWMRRMFTSLSLPELYVITVGLCAIGLILIPEVIYARDIYPGEYERSNTMFKLTYQAFIMFGITVSYIVTEYIFIPKTRFRKTFGCIALTMMFLEAGYFNECYTTWFSGSYSTLDATAFLKNENADDAEMIDYINENIPGQPVIAEMSGLSYTYFNRISAFTGCPTVIGWQTHEWLWRSSGNVEMPKEVSERQAAIRTLYSSQDVNEILEIIKKYKIDYIYYGECERVNGLVQLEASQPSKYIAGNYYEKLDSNLNILLSLGDVVKCVNPTEKKLYSTYLIKVR